MKKLEKRIIDVCLRRYKENLAAILIFGSYTTGKFVLGKSDIDAIILFKWRDNLDFEKEKYKLEKN